jgi:PAS domain S-box-containing protein
MKKAAARDKANPHIQQIDKKYVRLIEELSKSEQEKAVILDAMTEPVLFLDTDLKVIWANKAMHEAFNLKAGHLNGKHCYEALHKRSRACSICPAEKTLKTGEPHDVVDITSYKKNWVLRSYPVRDEKGSLSGVVEIVTDITERRRAEEAMRQSEQKFRELFENANDMIFLLDFKGKILSCNTAAARTYGYEPEQMHGMSLEELLDPEYLTVVRDMFRKKLSDLITNSQEFLTYTRTGEPVWVEINARSVIEEALKKRERELEEKSRNLQDANAALRVLLKRREDDKIELEEKVICNVRELILPHLENLKITPLDSQQLNQLNILERNTNEIISPFLRTLSTKYPNLTPMEIKVINFIKEGRTTKEMAELLNASARTIEVHRDNIRKKLGLRNRKANLKSHLMAL